jgi:hypothetical protein
MNFLHDQLLIIALILAAVAYGLSGCTSLHIGYPGDRSVEGGSPWVGQLLFDGVPQKLGVRAGNPPTN